jgi:hypothetical protein
MKLDPKNNLHHSSLGPAQMRRSSSTPQADGRDGDAGSRPYQTVLNFIYNGEGGIRTHGDVAATRDFKSRAFDHSATSPNQTGSKVTGCYSTGSLLHHFRLSQSHLSRESGRSRLQVAYRATSEIAPPISAIADWHYR